MAFRINSGVKLSQGIGYDILAIVRKVLTNNRYEVEIVDGPDPKEYATTKIIKGDDVQGVWITGVIK
jgi:hypothetical protein